VDHGAKLSRSLHQVGVIVGAERFCLAVRVRLAGVWFALGVRRAVHGFIA